MKRRYRIYWEGKSSRPQVIPGFNIIYIMRTYPETRNRALAISCRDLCFLMHISANQTEAGAIVMDTLSSGSGPAAQDYLLPTG